MTLAETIAREHFYCPGPFNEDKFSKDFALFMILKKQCTRFKKTGQINTFLAMNNLLIATNSFGKKAVNDICRHYFMDELRYILAIMIHLEIYIADENDSISEELLAVLAELMPRRKPTYVSN